MESWIIALGSSLILIVLTISIVLFHVKNDRKVVETVWQKLWLQLYYRHNLLPNFLETFKTFFPQEKKIFQELIALKSEASILKQPDSKKLHAELNISFKMAEIMNKCENNSLILADTNFLELKQNLKENVMKIDEELVKYNNAVREFNSFLNRFYISPLVVIFRLKKETIFEFEAGY